jgi:uncharacterized membrane protein YciS (DUF1049 family)
MDERRIIGIVILLAIFAGLFWLRLELRRREVERYNKNKPPRAKP